MLTRTLFLTTLIAFLGAANAADITFSTPVNQCETMTFSLENVKKPATIYIFTGCSDDQDTPVAEINGITEDTVTYRVAMPAGTVLFAQVSDADGEETFSEDFTVEGDPALADNCIGVIASSSAAKAASKTGAVSIAGSVPTTANSQSSSPTAVPINAAADKTGTANSVASTTRTNGASTVSTRPLGIFIAAMAIAVTALL